MAEIESVEADVDLLAEKIKRASFLISFCKGKLRTAEEEVKKVLAEMEEGSSEEVPGEEDNGF